MNRHEQAQAAARDGGREQGAGPVRAGRRQWTEQHVIPIAGERAIAAVPPQLHERQVRAPGGPEIGEAHTAQQVARVTVARHDHVEGENRAVAGADRDAGRAEVRDLRRRESVDGPAGARFEREHARHRGRLGEVHPARVHDAGRHGVAIAGAGRGQVRGVLVE